MIKFRKLFLFGIALIQTFYALAQVPTITSIDYLSNFPKNIVVFTGINYSTTPSDMIVSFGGVNGTVLSSNGTQMEVEIPENSDLANIVVLDAVTGLSVTSAENFFHSYNGTSPFTVNDLQDPVQYGSLGEQFDVCSCDLDNDGKRDMVTTKGSLELDLLFYRNITTDPTDIQFSVSSQNLSITTRNIACSDLNGDGKPELIFGNNSTGGRHIFYVLTNTSTPGNISFGTRTQLELPLGFNSIRMIANDLDYDGKPEIIVTAANQNKNEISIYKNQSTGGVVSFNNLPIHIELATTGDNGGIEIEDMDGDGKPEMIITQLSGNNIYVLKNRSGVNNISYDAPVIFDVGKSIRGVKVGDINSDGKIDIAVTHTIQNSLSVVLNTTIPNAGLSFELGGNWPTNTEPWGIDMSDIEGDGDLDVIVSNNGNSTLDVFINNTTVENIIDLSAFTKTVPTRTRNMLISDMNNDAKPDVIYTSASRLAADNLFQLGVLRNTNCFVPNIQGDATRYLCDQAIELESVYNPSAIFNWYKGGVLVQGPAHATNTVNDSKFIVPIGEVGTYKVEAVSEGGGCVITSNLITVNFDGGSVPGVPTVVNNGPGCEGSDVVLTVNFASAPPAGITYEWAGPNGFTATLTDTPSVTLSGVTPESIGIYTVIVSSGQCKTNQVSTNVEVISLPEFSVTSTGDIAFCSGGTSPLTVNTRAGYTYQWLKDGAPISGENGSNYSATQAGLYSVEVTELATTCVDVTNEVELSIFTSPTTDFSFPTAICLDESIPFTDVSTVDPTATVNYLWDFDNGSTSVIQNPSSTYNITGNYTVTLSISYAEASCSSIKSYPITVIAPEVINIQSSSTGICESEDVVLSTNLVVSNPIWSTLEATPTITVNTADTYTISGKDVNGCMVVSEFILPQKTIPTLTLSATPQTIISGNSVNLEAQGADTYLWSPPETLDDETSSTPKGTPTETTMYNVIGSLTNGCSAVDSIEVVVNPANNTAYKVLNLNGTSPVLTLENNDNTDICSLTIFDRYGSKVFEAEGNTVDWDGRGVGGELPQGTYFYVFNCGAAEPTTGSILLIRS